MKPMPTWMTNSAGFNKTKYKNTNCLFNMQKKKKKKSDIMAFNYSIRKWLVTKLIKLYNISSLRKYKLWGKYS